MPSVILHLKCKSDDLDGANNFFSELSYNPDIQQVQAFDDSTMNFTNIENNEVSESNKNLNIQSPQMGKNSTVFMKLKKTLNVKHKQLN